MNILYCAFGQPGAFILDKIVSNKNINDKIFCITYDTQENLKLIDKLKTYEIKYSLLSINNQELIDEIINFAPKIIISIYFRNLISRNILELALLGGINLHPSLLPKYRGAFSCPWSIINNEKVTGITYHYMNEKFDDGKIILQKPVNIENSDTAFSLYNKLINTAVNSFNIVYDLVVNKKYKGTFQEGKVSYYPREVPFNGYIDKNWNNNKIERYIRAMNFPGKPYAKLLEGNKEIEIRNMKQYLSLIEK